MMEVEPVLSDFSSCDRTGRRNAVPDIKGEGNEASTSEFSKATTQMDLHSAEGESSVTSDPPEGHGSDSAERQTGEGTS
ncbi:hypothetical protein JZ751_017554 [Albula glossodonta]|uniref:cAMP-dependent protein kinase inhibitor gamma n=1 Tax=Albula glossodonta TaxID=121402 RepID=A0A8T2PNW7_9TELE|nr:hypothetical protein JZ751_017554 [Albula glossodonta]